MSLWGISWVQLENEMTERQILLMAQRATDRLEAQSKPDRPRESYRDREPKKTKRSVSETVIMMMGRN